MSSSGRTYEVTGETTEWEDILIKKGIRTKEEVLLEKGLNPADFIEQKKQEQIEQSAEEQLEEALAGATLDELDELEDEGDFDDNRILDEYRQRRLDELKLAQLKNRFGDLCEITKADWIRDVTDCSKTCWVAVHLYQDSIVECGLVDEAMTVLAARFKYVKFVKIRSTQAIENWPGRNLPTVFFYHDGELKNQLITTKAVGGKSMKAEDLEWYMVCNGIVSTSELEEDPRASSSCTTGSGSPQKGSPSNVFRAAAGYGRHGKAFDSDDDL